MSKTSYTSVGSTFATKASVSGWVASALSSRTRSGNVDRNRCGVAHNGSGIWMRCSSAAGGRSQHPQREAYLWRAVDHEGEVLESHATKKRDKASALKLLKTAMKRYGNPHVVVTDRCPSYRAAMKVIGNEARQGPQDGRHLNNRAENSHLPFRRRERVMSRFRPMQSFQKFVSMHSSVYNHFNFERHINSRTRFKQKRDAALREWRDLLVA